MEHQEFKAILERSLGQNGIKALKNAQIEQFYRFTEHLLEVNAHTNLTAIRTLPEIISKHYADSLLASDLLPEGARVLDLGCGPGFPSIPLAIARPDLTVIGLDSTEKKIRFVEDSASLLRLSNLSAVAGRAEDRQMMQKLGSFDVVVSRAVARLNVLCELCLPYVKIGGQLVALKAAKADEELEEAQNAIKTLGGKILASDCKALNLLSGESEPRTLICIQKEAKTPSNYPRAFAMIRKKPL